VQVIDSAQTTASAVVKALQADGLLSDGGGANQFLATDGVDRFQRVGPTFFGASISAVELVDL
jgi:glutamate racemase